MVALSEHHQHDSNSMIKKMRLKAEEAAAGEQNNIVHLLEQTNKKRACKGKLAESAFTFHFMHTQHKYYMFLYIRTTHQ